LLDGFAGSYGVAEVCLDLTDQVVHGV